MAERHLAGTSVTCQPAALGEWEADGVTDKFKIDGNDYSDDMGDAAAWQNVGGDAWQSAGKVNGLTFYADTLHVGAAGLLTIHSKGGSPMARPSTKRWFCSGCRAAPVWPADGKAKTLVSGYDRGGERRRRQPDI